MSWKTLEVEREGPVMRVWLNRPDKRNALNTGALEEIEECFRGLRSDFEVRVVVLGGKGLSFCAGADRRDPPASVAMLAGQSERGRRYASQLGLRACAAIADSEVFTVARVHGHAVGGGFALALACDFRIASRDAVFRVPEVDLGVPLTWGATPRLIQEVGAARARELIVMCDWLDAEKAEAWGVVHRAVPELELDAVVDEWARRIAAKPEVAMHMTKTQFRSYARRANLGDVSETDGDLLRESSRGGAARESFRQESG